MTRRVTGKILMYCALSICLLIPGLTLAGPSLFDETLRCCTYGEDCYVPLNGRGVSKSAFFEETIMRCCRPPTGEGPCSANNPNYCKVTDWCTG